MAADQGELEAPLIDETGINNGDVSPGGRERDGVAIACVSSASHAWKSARRTSARRPKHLSEL